MEIVVHYQRLTRFGQPGGPAGSEVGAVRAVSVAPGERWLLGGTSGIGLYDSGGEALASWPSEQPVWSLAVDSQGRIWAGEAGQVEVFDDTGGRLDLWRDEERLGLVTAIHVGEEVLVADARARWIHRFDRQRRLVNHIGDRHRKGGFHIPNGVLDFAVDADQTIVVANPGMHRVERYRRDGESLGHFGRFGQQDPAGFPGCCNPTNISVGPEGEIVVSEKAGPRVKVYDSGGQLLSVVAEASDFEPASKNMDLAVTQEGAIAVIDTEASEVVVFVRSDRSASPASDGGGRR